MITNIPCNLMAGSSSLASSQQHMYAAQQMYDMGGPDIRTTDLTGRETEAELEERERQRAARDGEYNGRL